MTDRVPQVVFAGVRNGGRSVIARAVLRSAWTPRTSAHQETIAASDLRVRSLLGELVPDPVLPSSLV